MKSFSLSDLKKELKLLPAGDLVDICVSLAKFKKENKDFLGYILVDSYDKPGYIRDIKAEMDEHFETLRTQTNLYYIKKSLRKLLRVLVKYTKYANDKAIALQFYIYFCQKMKESEIPFRRNEALNKLYEQQLKKIRALIEGVHEDLQADFKNELEALESD